ncbi:DUF2975 domain-containing protein [Sphingorhabdus contaminans]|uniref:DUF2975 domain-containing protein n=1 Tax=Sphingorhabdus contaminans TaxID=1343899 RepID=A0A553WGX7_9SPHN|nr:DUF2975 domain-containing protein [Sphingorhabdus contaminans]TSB03928.1 DUF2975 domain-containing protein [Sphingorhabdus contaminans]
MTEIADNRILRMARWLVYLIMGFVAFAGSVLALVCVILPFYWTEAIAELSKVHPDLNPLTLLPHLLSVFALGILTLGLIWTVMRKLLAIIASVEEGNPFVRANAIRLKAIGWLMVGLQIVGVPLAIAAGTVADMFGESDTGWDFSLNGILAILLVFILAGIFERGAEMREELEGTI